MLIVPGLDKIDLDGKTISVRKTHEARLLGTFYCPKCTIHSPNDIFSPFRKRKCDSCRVEYVDKDIFPELLKQILHNVLHLDLFYTKGFLVSISIPIGVQSVIPLCEIESLKNYPIQKIYGNLKVRIPYLKVITEFNRDKIYTSIVRTVDGIDIIEKDINKPLDVRLVIVVRDTEKEGHIPAWEDTLMHAIKLVRNNELSLALVLLHTSFELFLQETCDIGLRTQNYLNDEFVKVLMDKPSIRKYQTQILYQITRSSYKAGDALWSKFHKKVSKLRHKIVHNKLLNIDKERLVEGFIITYKLMMYIMDQLKEEYFLSALQEWNRKYGNHKIGIDTLKERSYGK